MICAARKGFLTLSDCGDPAATMCENCGRPMCAKHLSPTSGFTKCWDCTAANPEDEESEPYDDAWAHRYRDEYYHTTGYAPAAYGTTHYDAHDRSSFDNRPDDLSEDESERGGFGDS